MKINKKLVKHGGSLAVVIPSEFTQFLDSDVISLELLVDQEQNPSLVITPTNELDTMENDPNFALFIETIYQDAMHNPHHLADISEILNEEVDKLIEGVNVSEDEKTYLISS